MHWLLLLILPFHLLFMENPTSIYDFQLEAIDGSTLSFSDYKGKKILLVNVASACGYTPQYQQMQELYENHGDKVVVIGVPSNDFGFQERGSNAQIQEFCSSRFGVTFPMAAKISVKGKDAHPLYQWLTQKELNGKLDAKVKWNFHKFLIDEEGQVVKDLPSSVGPLDQPILQWLGLD
jgi:glutathione peroxidase